MKNTEKIAWALFAIVVAVRLFLAFTSNYFDYDSYFHLRQIENIRETGLPIFNDILSQEGTFFVFPPFFHYVLAFFSLIAPVAVIGKILPNALYASLIPLSYYISREITENDKVSLIPPVLVIFMPVLWSGIFTLSPLCVAIPAIFYALYAIIKDDSKSRHAKFLSAIVIASLASPISLIAIPILWLYLIFLKIEKSKISSATYELIIFSTFFAPLVQFIFYKDSLMAYGARIIWQNIPSSIITDYFPKIGILGIIASIGILPFLFGLYYIYVFSFEKKELSSSIFVSAAIVAGLLMWARLITEQTGMILLGISVSLISAPTILHITSFLRKIKFRKMSYLATFIIFVFIASALPTSVSSFNNSKKDLPQKAEMDAMFWLVNETSENSVVVADLKDGFMINAVAKRKNVIDKNFLTSGDAGERFTDVYEIYTSPYETNSLALLNQYNAKYIFFGNNVLNRFNVTEPVFEDKKCFMKLFDENNVKIYKTWCDLE